MALSRAGERSKRTLKSGSVEGPSSLMAHQLSGDIGCISCSQEFPSRSQGPHCARLLRQHIYDLLHKSPGGFKVTSTLQTGMPNSPVVPREVAVSSSSLHPGGPQCRSRHSVETGAEAQGMEAPPRGGGADMEGIRPGPSGPVCVSRLLTVHSGFPSCIQLLSDWTQWYRCGRGFACFFPGSTIALLPGVLERVRQDRVLLLLIAPRWPGRVWLPDIISLLNGPPLELSRQEESSFPSRELEISPPT